jgi:hypothetical protein
MTGRRVPLGPRARRIDGIALGLAATPEEEQRNEDARRRLHGVSHLALNFGQPSIQRKFRAIRTTARF